MQLLAEAQHALGSAPENALARTREHARAYPNGRLAEEREVIAIDALLRLHRRSEAERRAAAFRRAHPSSAHLGRISSLLGASQR